MAAAAAAAALLLLAAAHSAAAIPYVHDDLLWTKQNWGEYRLPFPWAAVLKERDVESTRALQGPLRGFAANSLNGPVLDSSSLAQLVQEDARRCGAGQMMQRADAAPALASRVTPARPAVRRLAAAPLRAQSSLSPAAG